jgi:hypothetical protein
MSVRRGMARARLLRLALCAESTQNSQGGKKGGESANQSSPDGHAGRSPYNVSLRPHRARLEVGGKSSVSRGGAEKRG